MSWPDVSDEAPSDGKEDAYLIQSHPNIRLRRAAPDQKKPPPPESDKHAATDDTQVTAAVPDAITDSRDVGRGQSEPAKQCLPRNTDLT